MKPISWIKYWARSYFSCWNSYQRLASRSGSSILSIITLQPIWETMLLDSHFQCGKYLPKIHNKTYHSIGAMRNNCVDRLWLKVSDRLGEPFWIFSRCRHAIRFVLVLRKALLVHNGTGDWIVFLYNCNGQVCKRQPFQFWPKCCS